MLKPFFFFTAWPSHTARRGRGGAGGQGEGLQPPGNHDNMTIKKKKNSGGVDKQTMQIYNTVLLTNWTDIKNHKQNKKKKTKKREKETNSINIYGTHLWHKYAAVGLATLLSFFFLYFFNSLNQITMETVQKGEGVGRTRAFPSSAS